MASDGLDPYLARVLYGRTVREARTGAGFADLNRAAEETAVSYERLSNIETGRVSADEHETRAFIARYGIGGAVSAELLKLGESASGKGAPTGAPGRARRYSVLQQAADELKQVYPFVPGLFQTAEYALAQIRRSPVVQPAQAETRAIVRQERGDALARRTGCQVFTIVGEEALYRQTGGPEVLRRQLERLLRFGELDHVSIRVYPYSAGETAGLSAPFTLLTVNAIGARFAYNETLTGSAFVKNIGAFTAAFEDAQDRALPEGDTRELLERRVNDL